jgi:hypothetical protein
VYARRKNQTPTVNPKPYGAGTGARQVAYVGQDLWELELAWATTVHKAQGSESAAVLVVLSPAHKPLLTRRLLYTGAPDLPPLCTRQSPDPTLHKHHPGRALARAQAPAHAPPCCILVPPFSAYSKAPP